MQKPDGWDEATASLMGDYKRLPPGGYVCVIKNAHVVLAKTSGREQLVLALDIDTKHGATPEENEEYRNFFYKDYSRRSETNPDAKWSCNYYQGTQGESTKYFKGLMHLIEKSSGNEGYKWNFDEKSLKGRYIGMVFGEEERLYNGKVYVDVKPRFPKTTDDIMNGAFEIPEKRAAAVNPGNNPYKVNPAGYDDIPF